MFSNHVPLVEHETIHDTFVTGLARIEDVGGGNLRFTLFTKQRSTMFLDERHENAVTLRVVMHAASVTEAAREALMAASNFPGIVTGTLLDMKKRG